MIFKKLLVSLGILGVVGGSGAGIYYNLKSENTVPDSGKKLAESQIEPDLEKEKQIKESAPQLPATLSLAVPQNQQSVASDKEQTTPPKVEPTPPQAVSGEQTATRQQAREGRV